MVSLWDPSQRYWNALAFAQLAGFVTLTAVLLDLPRKASWTAFRVASIVACLVLTVKSGTRGRIRLDDTPANRFASSLRPHKELGNYLLFALLATVVVGGGLWALSSFGEQDVAGRWSSQTLDSDLAMRWASAGRLLEAWWSRSKHRPSRSTGRSRQLGGLFGGDHRILPACIGSRDPCGGRDTWSTAVRCNTDPVLATVQECIRANGNRDITTQCRHHDCGIFHLHLHPILQTRIAGRIYSRSILSVYLSGTVSAPAPRKTHLAHALQQVLNSGLRNRGSGQSAPPRLAKTAR